MKRIITLITVLISLSTFSQVEISIYNSEGVKADSSSNEGMVLMYEVKSDEVITIIEQRLIDSETYITQSKETFLVNKSIKTDSTLTYLVQRYKDDNLSKEFVLTYTIGKSVVFKTLLGNSVSYTGRIIFNNL